MIENYQNEKENSQNQSSVGESPNNEANKPEMNELSKCQKERDEYLEGWKRAKADLINYKKDEAKRFEAVIKFSNESLVRELINVLDSFDLALVALQQTQINADIDADKRGFLNDNQRESATWQKGLYLIRQQLEDILKQNGLERIIISVGQPFDPALQEAIATVESDKPSGTIIEEVERGYLLNGKLIRPARVKVAK